MQWDAPFFIPYLNFNVALPKWGQYGMGMIYASLPLFGGYAAFGYVCNKRVENLGTDHEKLTAIVNTEPGTTVGDTILINGKIQRVGAGGKFGGVKLSVSDAEDQKKNKQMLQAYLRQQERKHQRQLQRHKTHSKETELKSATSQ